MKEREKDKEENIPSGSWENSCPACGKDLVQEKEIVVTITEKG